MEKECVKDYRFFIGIGLTVFSSILLCCVNINSSSNHDEAANVVGGLAIWKYGRFDLYCVNPPITRMMASLPIARLERPDVDWTLYEEHVESDKVGSRPEFSLGLGFVRRNTENLRWYLFIARLSCLPFWLAGCYFIQRWAKELYGEWAGLTALTLWCFSPNLLTWGSMVMPDLPATSLGLMAGYFFWKWLRIPENGNAFVAGVTLGLALLTKLTWVILLPLFPLLWIIWSFFHTGKRSWKLWSSQSGQMFLLLTISLFVLNLGYGFEGTLTKIGHYQFASRMLAGKDSVVEEQHGGNLLAETTFASIPVPFPRNYIVGIDLQKVDFEKGLSSYLNGQWSNHGWWYYYLECAALKIPLGTWGLGILALVFSIIARTPKKTECPEQNVHWLDEMILLLPAIILLIFVSSQTGFSRHFRYVLPAFPFFFIGISRIAEISVKKGKIFKITVVGLLVWSIMSKSINTNITRCFARVF
ncbi:MAG: glycosyltransferase family 39 protein [Planctomycetaceae bacterium]|jgi:4-amino-4-deoxy-L-arabinose transferase-like glycosyltransferase|nr:glycosyltransferase family 39 protein [Planctomycetaceae bacterium]